MNSLLYNLGVVFLLAGLVLMVHHSTKIYYLKNYTVKTEGPKNIYDSYVYQERPKTLYSKMFKNLGPWIDRTPNPIDEETNPNDYRTQVVTQPVLQFN